MKLRTISITKGFMLSEIMLAFSLLTLFLTSAVVLSASMADLQRTSETKLNRLSYVNNNLSSTTIYSSELFGNDTIIKNLDPIVISQSNPVTGWGRDTCNPRLNFSNNNIRRVLTDPGNPGTDLEVRHGIAYITTDSTSTSLPDFYIIDTSSNTTISSLNTGPGLSALEVAGPYIFTANTGTTNQFQIIDITNRNAPVLISKFKLPFGNASSTWPAATSLFYLNGFIYLGTEKWDGNEFSVIDVHNLNSPKYLGGFNTDTLISGVYVRDGFAYVAASDIGQMRILDVHDPTHITQINQFSPTGWETQESKTISYFEDKLALGRTTGGFNVIKNHEIFTLSTTTEVKSSHDIMGGVYGIIQQPENLFFITHSIGHEFQEWDRGLTELKYDSSLGFIPTAISCDEDQLFIL